MICLLDVAELMAFDDEDVRVSAGQDNISLAQCRDLPIPVPPLEEQHKIVARLASMIAVCDELEAKLGRAEDRATKLAEAAVRELVQ